MFSVYPGDIGELDVCLCLGAGYRSKARPRCLDCGKRLPLIELGEGIRVFGVLEEVLPGFSARTNRLSFYWGVSAAQSPLGPTVILAEQFQMSCRDSFARGRDLVQGVRSPMLPSSLLHFEGKTAAYLVRPLRPSVMLPAALGFAGWPWAKKAQILWQCADLLGKFHLWQTSQPDQAAPAPGPSLQAIWPGNIVLERCAPAASQRPPGADQEDGVLAAVLDYSGWGRTLSVEAPEAVAFLPPEARVEPEAMDTRSDIWCLGALAYYLLRGTPPPADTSHLRVGRIGKKWRELIQAMLEPVPEFRPSVEEVVAKVGSMVSRTRGVQTCL